MSTSKQNHPALIDIGINLTNERYRDDVEQVIASARAVGVRQMVITGTDLANSERALCLANDYKLFATAGVHPHHAKEVQEDHWHQLKHMHNDARVLAVGETGLDFFRDFSPRPTQEKVFERQIQLACEQGLPLFMHQRDAHQRFFPMIKSYRDHFSRGVVHCFTGSQRELFDYLDLDLHIGITGWVCDERRGLELKSIVHNIPLNRLMIETDGPYLLPRSLKPKPKSSRNQPKYLPYIAKTIAERYQLPLEKFAGSVFATTGAFFDIPASTTN